MENDLTKNSKKSSKWWIWLIGVIVVLYIIGYLSNNDPVNTSVNDSKPLKPSLKLNVVANHSIANVRKELGKGVFLRNWKDRRSGCKACPIYSYRDDSLEVIYINGKADRITLNHLDDYNFDEKFITTLGLPFKTADFKNADVMRWYNYQGFREIMAFNNGNGQIHYSLVKTNAE
ncbi:hypothetical protein GCM10028818_00060 [Spirosoma horti]